MEQGHEQGPGGDGERNRNGAIIMAVIALLTPLALLGLMMCGDDDVRHTGERGEAKILRMVDTGNRFNHNPEMEFFIEVHVASRPPYNARAREVLGPVELQTWRPGAVLEVKVDPEDRERVVILGLKAEAGASGADAGSAADAGG